MIDRRYPLITITSIAFIVFWNTSLDAANKITPTADDIITHVTTVGNRQTVEQDLGSMSSAQHLLSDAEADNTNERESDNTSKIEELIKEGFKTLYNIDPNTNNNHARQDISSKIHALILSKAPYDFNTLLFIETEVNTFIRNHILYPQLFTLRGFFISEQQLLTGLGCALTLIYNKFGSDDGIMGPDPYNVWITGGIWGLSSLRYMYENGLPTFLTPSNCCARVKKSTLSENWKEKLNNPDVLHHAIKLITYGLYVKNIEFPEAIKSGLESLFRTKESFEDIAEELFSKAKI